MFNIFKSRKKYHEITPDEIFLDSKNLPSFDKHQFEGRLEKPITIKSLLSLVGFFMLVVIIFTSRIWVLQIVNGSENFDRSERNRLHKSIIFAERGVIYDRNGEKLAFNLPLPDEDYSLRKYTELNGFANMLGYVEYPAKDKYGFYYNTDLFGVDGVEEYFNDMLSGENGLKIVETDAIGEILQEGVVRPPEHGRELYLSIDSRIQNKLFELIQKTSSDYGFTGGTGAILDIVNGEVLAITTFPEYDSEALSQGDDKNTINALLNNPNNPFLDRFTEGLYTPGSIIKPFVALAALEEDIVWPERVIVSTGSIRVQNPYNPSDYTEFADWKAHGEVNLMEAIAVSSNVYFYSIGGGFADQEGLGIARIEEYLRKFGFGEGLPESYFSTDKIGTIPSPSWKEKAFPGDPWRVGDTYYTSIGQYGVQVVPMQVLRAVATLAGDGKVIFPTIISGGNIDFAVEKTLDFKKENFDAVKKGMRLAVLEGTAKGLNVPYVPVAAKTGTAELGVEKSRVNSWVIGFYPYEKPKYAFVVLMERGPRDNTIGGLSVMRGLMDWMVSNTPEYIKID